MTETARWRAAYAACTLSFRRSSPKEIISRREAEAITDGELQELIALTEEVERRDAERLRALAQLAELRRTTLPLLMETLGLRPGGDVGRAS